MRVKKTATLLMLLSFVMHAFAKERVSLSLRAQEGPMTLKENFALAKKYPTPSGWLLANACSGCHGTNGAEMDTEIPPIVGLDKRTFIRMMKAYQKEKASKSTVMTIVAEPLTDAEIEAMAEYFSSQKVEEWTESHWRKDVKNPVWVNAFKNTKQEKKSKECIDAK